MSGVEPLRLAGVSHRYRRVSAIEDLAIEIPGGCLAGVIGPDGVGKSTLLGLIAGAKRVQQGRVEVLGDDIADPRHRRRVSPRIAYMPQGLGRSLYAELSVRENLDFFGRLFGHGRHERQRRIAELLAATSLAPFPDRPVGKLSGGMKQKLGLCCALIHDPDLLVLDEPTTGVDPLSRRQFWELIAAIRAPARHERGGLHRLHGGGGTVRLAGRDGPGRCARQRLTRRADGTHGNQAARGGLPGAQA